MVRERFAESFERLREQSNHLANIERSGENFDQIVEQRVELDRLRDEVTKERKNIVSRYEPPAPDVVLAPRGYIHTRLFGKVAAGICVVLLVVAGFFFVRVVRSFDTRFPLQFEQVTESISPTDDGCQWRVQVIVRNDSDETVVIERVDTVLNREFARLIVVQAPTLKPGETGIVVATRPLLPSDGCADVDDINHGNLIMHLDNGIKVSRGI